MKLLKNQMRQQKNGNAPQFKSLYLIPLAILVAKILDIGFQYFGIEFTSPPDGANWFVSNFIEWFGVLYGILLPLILVRVWEQLDDIDREFDREADAVRILYEDLSYLKEEGSATGQNISLLLKSYVEHVIKNYPKEIKTQESLVRSTTPERTAGDEILIEIREQFRQLMHSNMMNNKLLEFLVPELFERLKEITDIRGDRISLASQRLFDSLRIVALITSILFVIPFYFAVFTSKTGVLDIILIIGVTLLVIFIYMIIEDLDEPFHGTWKVSDDSWKNLLNDINANQRKSMVADPHMKSLLTIYGEKPLPRSRPKNLKKR
ncbi:MAG: DUF4239 domain-containing protein [Anaerolineales bacterium]|nr:DUF4239 domain-containing protein [Anaerolineales bacterium]